MKLYEKIYLDFKRKIDSGEFSAGQLLPTEAQLQREYNVSRITAKHAYEALCAEYPIRRIPGRGSVLCSGGDAGRRKLIGLVLCDFDSTFGEELIKSVEATAERYGYSLILKRSFDNHKTESHVLERLGQLGVSGIIIQNCHGAFTKNLVELSLNGFPLISVDRYAKGLLIPCVTSDNLSSCTAATQKLLNCGHKNILLVSAETGSTSTLSEREEGFKQAHINCGITLSPENFLLDLRSPVSGEENDISNDVEKITERLKSGKFTAVVALERCVAGLCSAAAQSLGLTFPDDLEMICYDYENCFFSECLYTHIAQDEKKMGETAVEQLINQINGEDFEMRSIIAASLIKGKSTTF